MKRLGIILMGLLSGFGPDISADPKPIVSGDAELMPYLDQFVSDAESIGRVVTLTKDLSLTFGNTELDPNKKWVGYCQRTSKVNYIVIDRKYFESVSLDDREALLYHEFGHCLLNREHNETCRVLNGANCQEAYSLMYPKLIQNVYGANKPWYMQELFAN